MPELPIQYADYAVWQREYLTGETLASRLSFWRERLAGAPEGLELPLDRLRPAVPSLAGGIVRRGLGGELTSALEGLSRERGTTPFMTLLSALGVWLARVSGEEDLVVGTPVANRTCPEIERLIGFFVNILALRLDISSNVSFGELLERVREVCLAAYAQQDLPFEKLVEALGVERDTSRSPLFQVLLVVQNSSIPALSLPGVSVDAVEVHNGSAKFDLTLAWAQSESGLVGSLEYATDLFDKSTAWRLLGQMEVLLGASVSHPELRLSELPLLSDVERRQVLEAWNGGPVPEPDAGTLHELFLAQARRTPSTVAPGVG